MKPTEQQIADLYSAAVSAEVNDEAGDAASESSFALFDILDATGGAAHTIRVLIDRVRAAERAMNPATTAEDIAWWKQEAEDCKARVLDLAKENEGLRRKSEVTLDAAIERFKEYNIGFPVERFKADYVISWMLANYPLASPQAAPVLYASAETLAYAKMGEPILKVLSAPSGEAVIPLHTGQHAAPAKDEIGSWNNHKNPPTDKPKSELLQRAEKLAEDTAKLAQRVQGDDLRAKVRADHAEWAAKTFGDTGPVGPLKHLSQEALETAEAPDDLHEWADMQFLFWDAQRKAGVTDEQITAAMVEKLEINKARQWPEPKEGEPRLHIKDK